MPPPLDEEVEKHRVEEGTDTFVFTKAQLAKLITKEIMLNFIAKGEAGAY